MVGCSGDPNRAEVSGKVTLDGEPVSEGRIGFYPIQGNEGPSAGAVILNGSYKVPASNGVWLGKNLVKINALRKTGKQVPSAYGGKNIIEETEEPIPPVYNDRSQLIHDVQPGSNRIDFELRSR
jgi:hypothetical protein